ncbi:MAG: hypothetical protein ACK4NO_02570 [Glycocaulis sp.]
MRWTASLALAGALAFGGAALAQQTPSGTIQAQELGAVDPFQIGSRNVMPADIWASSDSEALRAILRELPGSDGPGWRQPAAARLAERALLASGAPPRGGRDDFPLAALRADRALAAGRAEQVFELLERTPRVNESPALSRVHAEAAFALGETDAACNTADSLLRGRDEPYWLRARAVCLALAGNMAAADLTADLARASEPDPGFDTLFDAFTLGRGLPSGAAPSSGIALALAALIAPDERIAPAADAPAWLKRAADRTGPPIALPEMLDEALEAAMNMEGADRAAALAAIAQQDLDRMIAAEALAARFEDAVSEGRFAEVARAYAIEIETLPINAETLVHGPRFVLALALDGDVERAFRWREALLNGPAPDRPEPLMNGFDATGGPASLTAPGYAGFEEPDEPWDPPAPGVLVALDMAISIAADDIGSGPFGAIMAARAENASPARLAQLAGLAALGASVPEEVRVRLLRDEPSDAVTREADLAAMAALSLLNRSRAEVLLQAAAIVEAGNASARSLALATYILAQAGQRDDALLLVLQLLAEETA